MLLLLSLAVVCLLAAVTSAQIRDEAQAWDWIAEYDAQAQVYYYRSALAAWNFNTNLTDHNQRLMVIALYNINHFQILKYHKYFT